MTRLSATQYDMAIFCGEQWERVHVLGQRVPPGIALHVGTGLHKVSEHNFHAKILTGEDEPIDVLRDVARDGYVHRLRDEGVYLSHSELPAKDRLLNEGLGQVLRMTEVFRADFAPRIRPVHVERRVTMYDEDTDIEWLGFVDIVDDTNTARDVKTSGKAWTQARADTETQATLYPRLLEATTGRRPDRFAFDVFKKLKDHSEYQLVTTTRDESDWRSFQLRAGRVARMIRAGLLPPADQGHWKCSERFCGFWRSCPLIPERMKRLPCR